MLKIFKNKKAQNTAEYAILIALVVGGVIAMQTYVQRAMQARLRDASKGMADKTNNLGGSTLQYEPYYSNSSSTTTRDTTKSTTHTGMTESGTSNRTGNESTTWNGAGTW